MSASPWVKWFSADFLNGISDLEPSEIAVYAVVLNLIYDGEGPIKDDAAKIGRRCNMRPTSAEKALSSLAEAGKITRSNGSISNARCEKEIESRRKVSEKSSESASARWKKVVEKPSEINKASMPTQSEGICETDAIYKPEPEKKEVEASPLLRSRPDDGWPKDAFPIWYGIYPRKKSPDAAKRAFDKVRRSGRVTWPELLAATQRYAIQPLDPKFTPHPATWLNAGSWNDEPDRPPIAANRPDISRSAADQVISATRRRVARLDPSGWSPSEGGFDFGSEPEGDDHSGRPLVIDHDGQKACGRGDDRGFSTLFLPSAGGFAGSH